jgi:hypothetical protein
LASLGAQTFYFEAYSSNIFSIRRSLAMRSLSPSLLSEWVFVFSAWRSSSSRSSQCGGLRLQAFSVWRSSSSSLLGTEVFISKPSRRGGLHLQGLLDMKVFVFEACLAWRSSSLSLLNVEAFIFKAFS